MQMMMTPVPIVKKAPRRGLLCFQLLLVLFPGFCYSVSPGMINDSGCAAGETEAETGGAGSCSSGEEEAQEEAMSMLQQFRAAAAVGRKEQGHIAEGTNTNAGPPGVDKSSTPSVASTVSRLEGGTSSGESSGGTSSSDSGGGISSGESGGGTSSSESGGGGGGGKSPAPKTDEKKDEKQQHSATPAINIYTQQAPKTDEKKDEKKAPAPAPKKSASVSVESVAGAIDKIEAPLTGNDKKLISRTAAEGKALFLLKEQRIVLSTSSSCDADPIKCDARKDAPACCWQWFKGGVRLVEVGAEIEPEGEALVLKVIVTKERNLSPEMVKYARNLPLDAKQRNTFMDNLRNNGVSKPADLAGKNEDDLVKGVEMGENEALAPEELKSLTQGIQSEVKTQTAASEKKPEELTQDEQDALRAKAVEEAAAAQTTAQTLMATVDQSQTSKEGKAAVKAAAQALMTSTQKKLAAFTQGAITAGSLKEATAAMGMFDETSKGFGGAKEGTKWSLPELISRNGLFRGVRLGETISATMLGQVVQLTPTFAKLKEKTGALEAELLLSPDEETTELSIQSSSMKNMQTANKVIDSLGMSSFNSKMSSGSFGVGLAGVSASGGVGASVSSSSSGGKATNEEQEQTQKLKQQATSLVKTRYFFEPRALIKVAPSMVEPTPRFLQAARKAAATATAETVAAADCEVFENTEKKDPGEAGHLPVAPGKKRGSGTANWEECLTACKQDPQCKQTVFYKASSLREDGTCWPSSVAEDDGSGTPSPTSYTTAHCRKEDVAAAPAKKAAAEEAAKAAECEIFENWQKGDPGKQAYLKIAPGKNFGTGVESWEACLNFCKADSQCRQTVYYKSGQSCFPYSETRDNDENDKGGTNTGWISAQCHDPARVKAAAEKLMAAKAASSDPRTSAALELFQEFGSHVCPNAELGGWWRITANYQSSESTKALEMSRAATAAIEDAASDSFAVGGQASAADAKKRGAGALTASYGEGKASAKSSETAKGSKFLSGYAQKNAVLDVTQEWKGGQSGGTPAQWRGSLGEAKSSNWKVIDRFADDCRAIWGYVEDPWLKKAMCQEWVKSFSAELSKLGGTAESLPSLQGACTSETLGGAGLEVRSLREDTLDKAKVARDQAEKKAISDCNAQSGMWWYKGKCQQDQRPTCKTSENAACGLNAGYRLKTTLTGTEKCKSMTCTVANDRATCCQDEKTGNAFTLYINTKAGDYVDSTGAYHVTAHYVKLKPVESCMSGLEVKDAGIPIVNEANRGWVVNDWVVNKKYSQVASNLQNSPNARTALTANSDLQFSYFVPDGTTCTPTDVCFAGGDAGRPWTVGSVQLKVKDASDANKFPKAPITSWPSPTSVGTRRHGGEPYGNMVADSAWSCQSLSESR